MSGRAWINALALSIPLLAAIIFALAGCASIGAYDPPPVKPGTVTWKMVEPQQVRAACGTALPVAGCYRPTRSALW